MSSGILDREKIVSNGCNGSCCTAFTLGYSLEDLKACQEALDNGKSVFIDRFGRERKAVNDPTLPTVIDMLIPLGERTEDPQHDKGYLGRTYGNISDADALFEKTGGFVYRNEDHDLAVQVFTCRHYDTVNKICTNYEGRPNLCKHFGSNCQYKGCGYAAKCGGMNELAKEDQELMQGNMGWFISNSDECGSPTLQNTRIIHDQLQEQDLSTEIVNGKLFNK